MKAKVGNMAQRIKTEYRIKNRIKTVQRIKRRNQVVNVSVCLEVDLRISDSFELFRLEFLWF